MVDAPAELLQEVAGLVQETMEHAMDLGVPLEVERKAGPNWYEMAPLERVTAAPA